MAFSLLPRDHIFFDLFDRVRGSGSAGPRDERADGIRGVASISLA
jgi:hypothetical protein